MRLLSAVVVAVCATAAAAVMVAGVLMALLSVADARVKAGPNVVSAHHRLRTPPGALDGGIVSAPAAAGYSFRLLRQAYLGTGAAVRLRRASDNAESDIGFSGNGDFDTASATAFCNATSCFVKTWYDQSGNARHATQATAANQPALVFNCIATLPCARATSPQVLVTANLTWASVITSMSVVANRSVGTTQQCEWTKRSGTNSVTANTANTWYVSDLTTNTIVLAATDAAWHAAVGLVNGAGSLIRVDGAESATAGITGTSTVRELALAAAAVGATCLQTEAILWDGYALTATERANLTANQRAYWGF